MFLSAYFQPNEADEVKAAQLAWWCDELQDWTREQVLWSLRKWNRENPRLRPTPGDILRICEAARGAKIAASMPKPKPKPEPPKVRVTPERMREIMAEANYKPRRMDDE